MTSVAILGFGVVGGGVADLIAKNGAECQRLGGDSVSIKYILDLREFPDSPYGDRVVHDYSVILNDPEVSVVIETMGGSHPAFEFSAEALKAGKSVITSNKEVVASFGTELLALALENGVSYRFEAAVGGGIPVISPMIHSIAQNKIREVRGILNGTTNYILTQMITYGNRFETALADAQKKGYAEKNPDADVLGTDTCRKIAILAALAGGKLIPPEKIPTKGITEIRSEDVKAADRIGCTIKLIGRCVFTDGAPYITVEPTMVPRELPLSGVCGVYNAVEIIADPLDNVMFYGRGAGAGATASAVVGDLMETMRLGNLGMPSFDRSEEISDISSFVSRHYIALPKEDEEKAKAVFGDCAAYFGTDECSVLTVPMSELELNERMAGVNITPISHIRLLA